MNLIQYRSALMSLSDYAPTSELYQKELDAYISQVYWMVWTARAWTFANREETISFFSDLNHARTGAAVTVNQFEREVVFSAPVLPLEQHWNWEGQVIELSGVDYEILMVLDYQTIRLSSPYKGDDITDDETWTIKHRYYYLPEDCINLTYLGNSDNPVPGSTIGGKQIGLQPPHVMRSSLREDQTATHADAYWEVPPVNIPPGEKLILTAEEDAQGAFPDNRSYEICWAFEAAGGRVGPLSQPQVIHLGEAEQGTHWILNLEFISHDDQPIEADAFVAARDTYPNSYEGLRKRIYFNQNWDRVEGERLGTPLWREVSSIGLLLTQYNHLPVRVPDEDSTWTLITDSGLHSGNPRYIEFDGQHRRIQPYPRIDGFDYHYEQTPLHTPIPEEEWVQFGRIKYNYKPHQLCSATDSPEMPYEFHDLLLWQALAELAHKHGDHTVGVMYEKRVEKRIKDLAKRYTSQVGVDYRRGQFGTGQGQARLRHPLTANGTKY